MAIDDEKNDKGKGDSAPAGAAPDKSKKLLLLVGAVVALVGILNIYFMLRSSDPVTLEVGSKQGSNKFNRMSDSQVMQLTADQAKLVPKACGIAFQGCSMLCKEKSNVKKCKACWGNVRDCVDRHKMD